MNYFGRYAREISPAHLRILRYAKSLRKLSKLKLFAFIENLLDGRKQTAIKECSFHANNLLKAACSNLVYFEQS